MGTRGSFGSSSGGGGGGGATSAGAIHHLQASNGAGGFEDAGLFATLLATAGIVPLIARATLTPQMIEALHETPVVLIPAPGANKILFLWDVIVGTSVGSSFRQISTFDGNFYLGADKTAKALLSGTNVNAIDSVMDQGALIKRTTPPVTFGDPDDTFFADGMNKPIVMQSASQIDMPGAISAHELLAGGADYAPGDTFTVDVYYGGDHPGVPATGTVNTVDGSGAVLTYTLNTPGDQYTDNSGNGQEFATTATSGIGSGLSINVTGVDVSVNTGRTVFELHYSVLDFAP